MNTLLQQNIRMLKRVAVFSVLAVVLTGCPGGGSNPTESRVIDLYEQLSSGQISEESFISRLRVQIGS